MEKNNNIHLATPEQCTGCSACAAICPTNSIMMIEDKEGFLQPYVDADTCIKCHKCERTCPVLLRENDEKQMLLNCMRKGFASKSKDTEERLRSSSGGISALLAHYVIQHGGVAVGVGFDSTWMPTYLLIENEEDIYKIQGSKYAQAKIEVSIYREVKKILDNGRLVLFTGLACQIEGIRSYLGKDYENLILVDLICLGISSPAVWRDYLDVCFPGDTIKHINFKDKSLGWHCFSVRIETNKRTQSLTGDKDRFMQSFFRTISVRRSCFNCPRRTIDRVADITLADCWGAYEKVPEMDDNKGLSAVVVHSQKGLSIFEKLDVVKEDLLVNDIVDGNPNMVRNIVPDFGNRNAFHFVRRNISKKMAFFMYCKYRSFIHMNTRILKVIAKKLRMEKLLNPSYWRFHRKMFQERYSYDIKLNEKWFGHPLTKNEFDLYEIKYLKAYRLAQASRGTIWFRYFYKKLKNLSLKSGIGLHVNLNIDHGLIIGHAGPIIMNSNAVFNGNIMITHGVTVGRDIRGKRAGTPTFGHNVVLRANSVIVGNIKIGDDVLIAPNTFVNFDVPSHSIVIGNPATIHHRDNATEGHIATLDE